MRRAREVINADSLSAVAQTLRNNVPNVKQEVVERVGRLNALYKRSMGIDELDRCQKRVDDLQEKLLSVQELRRATGTELAEVRRKSNELQDQLHKVKRQDNLQHFLELMREETELLKREQQIQTTFNDHDRLERDTFTAFTNAIRDSHEKQRNHLEHMKYWGMILSIAGSFISFALSSLRTEDVKRVIAQQVNVNHAPLVEKLGESTRIVGEMCDDNRRTLEELLRNVERHERGIEHFAVQQTYKLEPAAAPEKTKETLPVPPSMSIYQTSAQLAKQAGVYALCVVAGYCFYSVINK